MADPARTIANRIFIVLIVVSNSFGNFLLALGMHQMPAFTVTGVWSYTGALASSPDILGGVALLLAWMIAQLTMYTWADLSYILPVTASGYVLTALLGKFFLGEYVSSGRWAGVLLIAIGSALVSMTPVRTLERPPGGEA